MAWAAALLLTAVGTFLVGFPFSAVGATSSKRWIGWLGVAFSVAPGPLGFGMLRLAMALRGFELEE